MRSKVIITLSVLIFLFAFSAKAQCDGGNSALIKLAVAAQDEDYDISIQKSYYLSKGEYGYFYKTFYSGNHYVIVGYSETDDVDVDLYVYDPSGDLYDKDDDSEDIAVVEFDNYSEREMKVKAVVYDAPSSYSNYEVCIIVFYK